MQRWRHLRKKYSNLHSFHIRNPNPCVDWIEERNIFTKRKLKWHISTLLTSVFIFEKNSTNAGYIKGNNCTDAKYISLCGNQFICWPPIVHTPPWTEKPDNLVKNGESRAAYFSITSVNYFETQIERDRGCQILKDTRTSISFVDKEDCDIEFEKRKI